MAGYKLVPLIRCSVNLHISKLQHSEACRGGIEGGGVSGEYQGV